MTKCPVCRAGLPGRAFDGLAGHLLARAAESEPGHVRWLNQSIGKERRELPRLVADLERVYALPPEGLAEWIRRRFIGRFFGPRPHPFVLALQHPTRATLLGYAVEHQHFLRQWVRSCAFIVARTDRRDVTDYELDNLRTEFMGDGPGRPAHYELLLRMGEAGGIPRAELLATPPLPTTAAALAEWQEIAASEPWVAAMAAMHSLELIAHRDLLRHGASVRYFDPAILEGNAIPAEARAFLREGYEADVGHSDAALSLVERYARELDLVGEVQSVFLRSMDLFDDYLGARLERAETYGPTG
jgi:pyrroloquinoline-quinone synthase